jgi:hypothetical protein
MSNGTGVVPMRKVLALIEAGLLDVSIGPRPVVEPVPGRPAYLVRGTVVAARREVEVVVEGRAHAFDPERDTSPLYPNLLRRGLVRRWRNPGCGRTEDFLPGALDLTRDFHPVGARGSVEHRLTVLGAPAEGLAFFQLTAARPRSNSAVLNTVARWANEVVDSIAGEVPDADAAGQLVVPEPAHPR